MSDAYKDAGVDIDAGEAVVSGIKAAVKSTTRPEVLGGLGGFAGLFALGRYTDPILVSGTDGVGTKLLVAQRLGRHRTIGIDLVAMCVNDIVCCGAEPLFFLDYFATGKLAPEVAIQVVEGIADGCRQSGCALIGGETAEMPGMYGPGHYDLAGFAVGAVERADILTGDDIRAGDVLVGLDSSGLHSNGFSLVRKLVDALDWEEEHGLGRPLGDVLLEPTRIYVQALKGFDAKAFVHITGGGFPENLPRALPEGLGCRIDTASWEVPPIFRLLQRQGDLSDRDLYRTFNMGIGMVAFVSPDKVPEGARVIGHVEAGEGVRL
jgi:phosphoribosylformylglycinamidine cyclo-ligase